MTAGSAEQRNGYKGSPPRPWVRLRWTALDGTTHEAEFLADTGNPCAIVLSESLMAKLKLKTAPDLQSNFGLLNGGWLRLTRPELGLDQEVVGYSSDAVAMATKSSCADFEGLAGLPILRLAEFGGDSDWFWFRPVQGGP